MTKIALDGEKKLDEYMHGARDAATALSPLLTAEIQQRGLDTGQAIVAVLLYAAALTRRHNGQRQDFVDSAAQAYDDSEELFASAVVEVLERAKALVQRGWCQGELALKWVKDLTQPSGKRLTNCNIKDAYASRWSALGAVDAASDSGANQKAAREALFLAVRDSGYSYKPGSLLVTVLTEWNDQGWAPPLPEMRLPERPEGTDDSEPVRNWQATVDRMAHDYETKTKALWPKPRPEIARKREEVLAVLDKAIEIARGAVA